MDWPPPRRPSTRRTNRIVPAYGHRALKLLASSPDGCTDVLMLAHGVAAETIAALVRAGLASATTDTLMTGDRLVDVVRVQITDAGRAAWAGRNRPGPRARGDTA